MEGTINMSEVPLTAKDKMARADALLDQYEQILKLPIANAPGEEDELQKYLCMDRDMVEKMTLQECKGIAYRISSYSFFLQRSYNREQARVIWAETELNNIIAQSSGNYDKFTKHEIKVGLIIKEDSYAQAVQKILVYAKQRATRLTFLSASLNNLKDTLLKG